MLLELKGDGSVILAADGLAMDSFNKLSKKRNAQDYLRYIYYMYSPFSKFIDMLPDSRKKLIEREVLKKKIDYEDEILVKCVEIFIEVSTDPKFILLEGVKKKISEYIDWWNSVPVTGDNHKVVQQGLVNSEKLYILKTKLENEILENQKSKEYGGGKAKLFEQN